MTLIKDALNIVFDNRMNRNPERQISTREAIENIINYSDQHGNLLEKYNTAFFVSYFDSFTIEELEEKLGRTKKLTKEVFVRQLTCFILHRPQETLFLVMGLLEVFGRILRELKSDSEITLKDFTCFLCNSISSNQSGDAVNTKEIPQQQLHPNPRRVREIDMEPAKVEMHPQRQVPKIAKDIKRKQRKVDSCRPLHTFYYNHERKEIITLGRLASHISIFNLTLKRTGEIRPACFKLYDKSMAIMSMAFSQRQQRIGCIIANLGMAFWDYRDGFETQKLVKRVIGDRIYYLPLLDEWVTTDNSTLYFWDLKDEHVKAQFGESTATSVNDVKQINHLRCLAVSYTLADKYKWLYIYRNDGFKVGSRLKLAHVGAQKIHYNRCTQTLLLLGMNQLPVYDIDKLSLDLSLLKTLSGHDTIITSIADLSEGLVVTGDDRGTMKVWDLQSLRCQQVIKVANTINKIECIGNTLLYSDSRINLLKVEQLTQQAPPSEMFGFRKFYRFENPIYEVLIFTTYSCRVYDLVNGRVKRVVEICINEEEIIAVERLQAEFLVSTSKGWFLIYSHDMQFRRRLPAGKHHEEEVHHLKADLRNRFVTAVSKEGTIQVWSEKGFDEGPRKVMLNDCRLEVTCFDLSEKYSVMVTGERLPNLKLWDYESLKLCHIIELESPSCAVRISYDFPLLAVACVNEKVYLYKMQRTENVFEITFAHVLNLRYPENSLNSILSIRTFNEIKAGVRREEVRSLCANSILLVPHNKHHFMVLSYGKGSVIAFSLTALLLTLFQERPTLNFTLNIQRPIRESLQKQLVKNQFGKTRVAEEGQGREEALPTVWNKMLHKDTITDLDCFQQQYISTLSLDGYFKVATLDSCEVICSLCIRYPLPTIWKLQIFKHEEIGRKLYESLKVIAEVLNDRDSLSEDDDHFRTVEGLMREVCQLKLAGFGKMKQRTVRLLKDELSVQDLRQDHNSQSEQSLKYLEAYRRVNLMKQVREVHEVEPQGYRKGGSSLEEKEHLQKFLSPSYFPNLYARQEQDNSQIRERYQVLFARSANVSLNNSRERLGKLRDTTSKERSIGMEKSMLLAEKSEGQTRRREEKEKERQGKLPLRSLSQGIKVHSEWVKKKPREGIYKEMEEELKKNLPLKSLSLFMKNLNKKIPKENQIRKHAKRISNFNSMA